MTESSSSSGSSGVNIYDDVYEPSEILVEHIGENDSEAAVCGSGDEDSSCGDAEVPTAATTTTNSYPPTFQQPAKSSSGVPSAERRRRRRRQSTNMLDNDYNVDNGFIPISSRQGRSGDNWIKYETAILGIFLFLAIRLLSLRDKIMHDIRRTRQDSLNVRPILFLPRYIRQIPAIASILLKNVMSEDIIIQSKRLITNPLQLPQILYELLISLWDVLCDLLQQLQYFLRSLPILRTLFGADMMIIGDEVFSDAIPELEDKTNNDVGADHDHDKADAANGYDTIPATEAGLDSNSSTREIRYDIDDLPPAFENEEDYPPGWLMYHPKYGVRTREFLLEQEGKA